MLFAGLLAMTSQISCGSSGGSPDQAAPSDLTTAPAPDLSSPPDLSASLDLASASDLKPAADQGIADLSKPDLMPLSPDLKPAPDLLPPNPVLTSIAPSSGSTAGGTAITITGKNFVAGSTLTIDGAAATAVIVNATTITATTPAVPGAFGLVPVVVKSPDGQTGSGDLFAYSASVVAFPNPVYQTGPLPIALAYGDFNGDGKKDMVSANNGASTISVLLGDGKGGFGAQSTINLANGALPEGVAVADFNADSKADIVVLDGFRNQVILLLGDGTGKFSAAAKSPFGVGTAPQAVAVSDFNSDGKPDLVVANYIDNTVSVLLGDGAGGFATSATPKVGVQPYAVAVGDVNGDKKPDIAVVNQGANTLTILLGDGTGNFAASSKSPFTIGAEPQAVALGDLNGDGKLDVVVANYAAVVTQNLGVLLGDGTGNFGAQAPFSADTGPTSLVVADVNGDGKLDVMTANQTANTASVLLGDGTGKLGTATGLATGELPAVVVGVDLNGDGKLDLAFANGNSGVLISNNISVVLGAGNGTFAPQGGFPSSPGSGTASTVAADMNNDGKLDFVDVLNSANKVGVVLGDGTGKFAAGSGSYASGGNSPIAVVVADFNGDKNLDVAVTNTNSNVAVLLGSGAGTLGAAATFSVGSAPKGLAAADFNSDGKMDLAVVNGSDGTVSILLGDGTGKFAAAVPYAVGAAPFGVAVGDFNGDKVLDLAVANTSGTVSILLGAAAGTFGKASSVAAGNRPQGITTGDLNGDGFVDLIIANRATDVASGTVGDNAVSVLLGKGNGTFGALAQVVAGSDPYGVVLGDFNGDGKLDISVADSQGGSAGVLIGDGTGSFALNGTYSSISAAAVAVGDFNGDGKPDIVAGNAILLNLSK